MVIIRVAIKGISYLKFTDKRLSPNDSRLFLNLVCIWFLQAYNIELLSLSQTNLGLATFSKDLLAFFAL